MTEFTQGARGRDRRGQVELESATRPHNMDSYTRSTPPELLTPNERLLVSADPVLAHYRGSIREYQKGDFHVCDLCRAWKVKEFFAEYNSNFVGREQELQEMAYRLRITQDEYNANQQQRDFAEVQF